MIRVAVIGLGKMGISHLAALNTHADVKLVAVCDATQYLLDSLQKYMPLTTYTDYRKLLSNEQLDAVFIATPSKFHAEMVREALNANVHVFCEKPFCLDASDALELAALAERKKLVSQVGYHCRFIGVFNEVKRLLELNILGRLNHVRAEAYGPVVLRTQNMLWRTDKSQGGGCLHDYACHAIDLVHYLMERPQSVGGAVLNQIFSQGVEDEVYASLYFGNGATGQIAANWSDEAYRKMSIKVCLWGTNGTIIADRQELQIYLRDKVTAAPEYNKGWSIRYTTDLTKEVSFYLRGEEYAAQVDHFVEAVQAKRLDTRCTFRAAADADLVTAALVRNANSDAARFATDPSAPPQLQKSSRWGRFARSSKSIINSIF